MLNTQGVGEEALFVGHSMGRVGAFEVAATEGDRITAVVSGEPPLPGLIAKWVFEGRVKAVEAGGSRFVEKDS